MGGTIRLRDGREYYRLDEAEGREFGTYDVYLYELVLLFFGLGPDEPIIGRATLMGGSTSSPKSSGGGATGSRTPTSCPQATSTTASCSTGC